MLYFNQKIKRRASHPITDRKPSNTTTKILLIKSTVSKESHNSMAKITIMYMIFKNKLIIYITPPVLFPHNLNIHHSVFYYGAKGEISVGENVRRRWICPDFILSLCHQNTLST